MPGPRHGQSFAGRCQRTAPDRAGVTRRTSAEQLHRLCANARTAVDHISILRGQILALARVEPSVVRRVDPAALVTSIHGLVALALGPDIDFDLACPASAPPVMCDVQAFENAIFNLVANARDAMPHGGRVGLRLDVDGQGPLGSLHTLRITVCDTGDGMSAEVMSQAIKPFFTTKSPDRGTGLGLAMVSEFARRSGGTLELRSQPGVGTTAVLCLPSAD